MSTRPIPFSPAWKLLKRGCRPWSGGLAPKAGAQICSADCPCSPTATRPALNPKFRGSTSASAWCKAWVATAVFCSIPVQFNLFFWAAAGFHRLSAVAGGWPSGLAWAPKVASAPRGPVPRQPCGQPGSIPAAGPLNKHRLQSLGP